MKAKNVNLITMFFMLSSITSLTTVAKETETPNESQNVGISGSEKHYTYCYAVDREKEIIYVSDILWCYFSDVSYKETTIANKNAAKSSLVVKWGKKVDVYTDEYTDENVMYWTDSFNDVDEGRDEIIADYKEDGYRVNYINMRFDCD